MNRVSQKYKSLFSQIQQKSGSLHHNKARVEGAVEEGQGENTVHYMLMAIRGQCNAFGFGPR